MVKQAFLPYPIELLIAVPCKTTSWYELRLLTKYSYVYIIQRGEKIFFFFVKSIEIDGLKAKNFHEINILLDGDKLQISPKLVFWYSGEQSSAISSEITLI